MLGKEGLLFGVEVWGAGLWGASPVQEPLEGLVQQGSVPRAPSLYLATALKMKNRKTPP